MEKKIYMGVLVSMVILLILGLGYFIGTKENKTLENRQEIAQEDIQKLYTIGQNSFLEINYHDDNCSYLGKYDDIIISDMRDEEKLEIIANYARENSLLKEASLSEDEALELCGNFVCEGLKLEQLQDIMSKYNFANNLIDQMAKKDDMYYFQEINDACSNIKNISHNYSKMEVNNGNIVITDLVNVILDDYNVVKETRKYTFKKENNNYYLYKVNNNLSE